MATAPLTPETRDARARLIALGARYHRAGWLYGTSGTLSMRVGERVVVTASGHDKGELGPEHFVEVALDGTLLAAGAVPGRDGAPIRGRPSAETSIHLALYRTRPEARCALHVHTVASTLCSPVGPPLGDPPVPCRRYRGLELIKGWGLWEADAVAPLPIFPNWPDVTRIANEIEHFYRTTATAVPALVIRSHGITAWGEDDFAANRHLEVTEFLCQVALATAGRDHVQG